MRPDFSISDVENEGITYMKKVSIIIPVYNSEKYIEKCVKSCMEQTYGAIQILLIDDGSTDRSGEMCNLFAQLDNRITVIHKENSGVSDARNVGIVKADGDYITFLDSDDWLEKNAIEFMLSEGEHKDFVIAGMSRYDEQGRKKLSINIPGQLNCETQKQVASALFAWKDFFNYRGPCAKLYRRDLLIRNHVFFDSKLTFGEDTCFVLKYMEFVENSIQCDCSVYNYRIYNSAEKHGRYKTEDVEYQWRNGFVLYESRVNLFKKIGFYNELKDKIDALYVERIRFFMNICVSNHCNIKDVIAKLKRIPQEIDMNAIKGRYVLHPLDKLILFFCKHRRYKGLYCFFVCKIAVYNRLVH